MGWLLTLWLALPLAHSEVEVRMWFSRESYCRFAEEKFRERPIRHMVVGEDGSSATAPVLGSECRRLGPDESEFVPTPAGDGAAAR